MTETSYQHHYETYDLAVIGSGIAGMAASLFAANRDLKTVQIGNIGGILFSPGLLDLISVYPQEEQKVWEDPWACLDELKNSNPGHPYSRIKRSTIEQSFTEILSFLEASGMKYHCGGAHNLEIVTAIGTKKYTYCVPGSMWEGVVALKNRTPCLFLDFHGLKEYSARQLVETIGDSWPGVRTAKIHFPGSEHRNDIFTGHMAQALEISSTREKLAARIKPELASSRAVGLPAIMGVQRTDEINHHLAELLSVPVFEVPTMPMSVPGLRMKEAFDVHLHKKGINRLIDKRVNTVRRNEDGIFSMTVGGIENPRDIYARAIVLATGRFMGKGLLSDRKTIREPLFNLPLYQPESRKEWHRDLFFDKRGHTINSAGVEVDNSFRPVNNSGAIVYDNLFAVGSILAHQDWMRMKCGSGLALATSLSAIESIMPLIANKRSKDH